MDNQKRSAAWSVALLTLVGLVVLAQSAQAQTYKVIHNFTGGVDGANPAAGLTMDAAGNLYGTAASGGSGYGTVFKLKHSGGGWTFAPLYAFAGGDDAATPLAGITIGPDGTLYGDTYKGGGASDCVGGCGTVYNLKPPARACSKALCTWSESVLHSFRLDFSADGLSPLGNVVFDQNGNLFGITGAGGVQSKGTVYELTLSNGSWIENILYNFAGGNDGEWPLTGVVFGSGGNLYGTTPDGGSYNGGVVYQLTPSGSGWVESVIHAFQPATDGRYPVGMIADGAGNLYGATNQDGQSGAGTVYQLSPSNGNWTFTVLNQLPGGYGCGAEGPLVMDTANNLYGATTCSVFKLTPSSGGWIYTDLHDFIDSNPNGSLVIDASGNLYGTTANGGTGKCFEGCGVVFEITP
jgi:uncharacterized repeat protein (TIGR03803 family)